MDTLKKQIIKKDEQFVIVITAEEARKLELFDGDIIQIEKCKVIPISDDKPDDLDSYKE